MIIDITVTLETATATATAVNDIAVTVVLNDEIVNPEETFCERVDDCLNIPEADGSYVLTIESGVKSWSEYSPTGAVIISKTKAEFLALVSGSTLQFPATYKITDVSGFEGLFIDTTSASDFSLDCFGKLIVPDYTPSGVNLGQMDWNTIPSVAAGEKVIWGDHYWANETGAPITPTISDQITLAGGLTQKSKSIANGYSLLDVHVVIDVSLNIYSIVNPFTGSNWTSSTGYQSTLTPEYGYIYAQINSPIFHSDLTDVRNYLGDLGNGIVLYGFNGGPFTGQFNSNTGIFSFITLEFGNNQFNNNVVAGSGNYNTIKLVSNSRFNGNSISGAGSSVAQMGFIELFDNCEMLDNTVIGDGAIWDIRTGENSKVNNNTIDVPSGAPEGSPYAIMADIDQMHFDEVNDNNITLAVAPAAVVDIIMIRQYGFSKLNSNTLSASGCSISHIKQTRAELTGFTLSQPNLQLSRIDMINSKLRNGTDISITDFTLKGDYDIDLTGFTTNINSETIENGKGWFTITHNFTTSPLTIGSSFLYNLIPNGARLTNITASGTLTGTNIAIGLETDDEGLISGSVGLLPVRWDSISNAATANRSLKIAAIGGDITAGTLNVKVEFVI